MPWRYLPQRNNPRLLATYGGIQSDIVVLGMEFLNENVDIQALPRAGEASFEPIHGAYLKVLRWEWLIAVTILLVVAGVLVFFIPALRQLPWITLTGGVWLLITAGWFFLQEKNFHTKAYAVRDKDILYRSGWVINHIHTCPFNRILHSTVTAGPLERRYGIATLVLYTAGPSDTDLHVRGLQEADAYALKEWIAKKIADEPVAGE